MDGVFHSNVLTQGQRGRRQPQINESFEPETTQLVKRIHLKNLHYLKPQASSASAMLVWSSTCTADTLTSVHFTSLGF